MIALERLVTLCMEKRIRPEDALGVAVHGKQNLPLRDMKGLTPESATRMAVGRLPLALEKLVKMRGFKAAELVSALYALKDCKSDKQDKEDLTGIPGTAELVELHRQGISLAWLCFGQGTPTNERPYKNRALAQSLSVSELLRLCMERQNLNDFERFWWVGYTRANATAMHRGLTRMLCSLPQITVFPEMPEISDTYERLVEVINGVTIHTDIEPWMVEVITDLKEHNWHCCVLFFSTSTGISAWKNGNRRPRLIVQRYGYLIERILEMFGNSEGLFFLLRVLNEEAQAQGYEDLNQVVRMGTWRLRDLQTRLKEANTASGK